MIEDDLRPAAIVPSPDLHRISTGLIFVLLVWGVLVAGGVMWVWNYKATPGLASGPPAVWPESVPLPRSGTTLVVALHPLCTCSQATVSELARLLASVPKPPAVYALFIDFNPRNSTAAVSANLARTSLWQRAAAIPGVTPIADPHGAFAKSFRAETSGDVIAYSARGELLFHGGLTAARGHEGDSFGRQRLLAVLRGHAPDTRTSPVFGCPLQSVTRSEVE
jgi:hypothetical protein